MTKVLKLQICQEFTDSASRITGLPKQAFMVFIRENDLDNVSVGGELVSDLHAKAQANK